MELKHFDRVRILVRRRESIEFMLRRTKWGAISVALNGGFQPIHECFENAEARIGDAMRAELNAIDAELKALGVSVPKSKNKEPA